MKQNILAVDDQPHMLVLLERIIKERTPYQITTTNNPLEVPKILETDRFDLIISDLKMPEMDGLELLDFVNKNERKEKVIIITAFGDLESAIRAMQGGAFDYITKPFKKEQILYAIDRVMNWQELVKETEKITSIMKMSPYKYAEKAFKKTYVVKLALQLKNQVNQICKKSGLSQTEVQEILKDSSWD